MTRDPLSATQGTRLYSLENDEFLPPLSRWTTLGGLFLLGTFGAAIVLASVTKYNATVRAAAIVRPAGEVRIVQAATEGTIENISVSENQTVKAGDAIAKIDDSRLRNQKSHLEDNLQQCEAELDQLNRQLSQLEIQILATAQAKSSPSQSQLTGTSVEVALVHLASSMPELAQQLSKDRRILLVKRSEIQKQLIEGRKELYQVGMKLENSAIQSPIDGTILKMELRNPGQTVQPGTAIAQIVPSDVPLVIKARVAAQDIGPVKVGQPVQIRISAFPYPDYGTLKGKVNGIAPDAIALPTGGSGEAYYEVTIQPERSYLVREESANNLNLFGVQKAHVVRQYAIQSGMEGRADIITGQETVLTFVLRKARLIADF